MGGGEHQCTPLKCTPGPSLVSGGRDQLVKLEQINPTKFQLSLSFSFSAISAVDSKRGVSRGVKQGRGSSISCPLKPPIWPFGHSQSLSLFIRISSFLSLLNISFSLSLNLSFFIALSLFLSVSLSLYISRMPGEDG